MIAATPRPRPVSLVLTSAGTESVFSAGNATEAIHFVLHVEIGGVAGFIAPMVGKQPPDLHVWIQAGAPPMFVKSEHPLYVGGPSWRIELARDARR
jgi:hypothetical protein